MCIDCVGCCFRVQHTISVVTPHTHTHTHKFTLVLCLVSFCDVSLFWVLGETDLSSDWSVAGLRSAASSVSYWLGLNVFPSAFDADSSLLTALLFFVLLHFSLCFCFLGVWNSSLSVFGLWMRLWREPNHGHSGNNTVLQPRVSLTPCLPLLGSSRRSPRARPD